MGKTASRAERTGEATTENNKRKQGIYKENNDGKHENKICEIREGKGVKVEESVLVEKGQCIPTLFMGEEEDVCQDELECNNKVDYYDWLYFEESENESEETLEHLQRLLPKVDIGMSEMHKKSRREYSGTEDSGDSSCTIQSSMLKKGNVLEVVLTDKMDPMDSNITGGPSTECNKRTDVDDWMVTSSKKYPKEEDYLACITDQCEEECASKRSLVNNNMKDYYEWLYNEGSENGSEKTQIHLQRPHPEVDLGAKRMQVESVEKHEYRKSEDSADTFGKLKSPTLKEGQDLVEVIPDVYRDNTCDSWNSEQQEIQ
ncbi:uncharacterized protein LOC144773525 [Lissotriton helveticus]